MFTIYATGWEPYGYAILDHIDYVHRRCYGQVQLQNKFRGRGIGTQAFKQLIKIAFDILGMNKICFDTLENNEFAQRTYKKLGFKVEGILRKHYWKEGQFVKFTKRIISAMSMYNNIEGLVWSTNVWATAEEIAAAG